MENFIFCAVCQQKHSHEAVIFNPREEWFLMQKGDTKGKGFDFSLEANAPNHINKSKSFYRGSFSSQSSVNEC